VHVRGIRVVGAVGVVLPAVVGRAVLAVVLGLRVVLWMVLPLCLVLSVVLRVVLALWMVLALWVALRLRMVLAVVDDVRRGRAVGRGARGRRIVPVVGGLLSATWRRAAGAALRRERGCRERERREYSNCCVHM
jgi:hypothetical protein